MENTPLSPHLQVYRPQLTSVLSITHRATGVVLSLAGTIIMLYWFVAAALGADRLALRAVQSSGHAERGHVKGAVGCDRAAGMHLHVLGLHC